MSKKYPVFVEFSQSGKLARIVHKNGKTVAILLCNPLKQLVSEDNNGNIFHDKTLARHFQLIHEYKNVSPIEVDAFLLEDNETIDLQTEKLVDRQTKKEITE